MGVSSLLRTCLRTPGGQPQAPADLQQTPESISLPLENKRRPQYRPAAKVCRAGALFTPLYLLPGP